MAGSFLGIDVGTSGTKALLLSAKGRVLATATAEHQSYFPRPGWSEQKPQDWWSSACAATRRVLRKAGVSKDDVAGVGLSGQMHGSVFLDKRGEPIGNAILWNDQRTAAECGEIEQLAGGRDELIRQVCNVALTGYQAPKILWLRRNQPRQFQRVRAVLLPKDYVRFRMTGDYATDVSDASGTLVFDVRRRDWARGLMEKLGLDPAWFPRAFESPEVTGTVSGAAARELGLRKETPVVAGAGDQAAAAVGTGVVQSGIVSATLGTSGVVLAFSASPVANEKGLLQSYCHAVPGAWCVFGCMLSAGGSFQWAREVFYADQLAKARTASARDAIYTRMIEDAAADKSPDAVFFHPYLTGERCPYPHPHARAALLGMTRGTTRAAIVRAVLEGITMGMERQVDMLRDMGVHIHEVRLTGGGARNPWWRQLQADVYGCRCAVLKTEEGSAMGAALLAGVGAGAFASVDAVGGVLGKPVKTYTPNVSRARAFRRKVEDAAWSYEMIEHFYRESD